MNSEPLWESIPRRAEGQRLPDLVQGRLDAGFAAAQHGARLAPRGVEVGDGERTGELPVGATPRMGDQV